MSEAEVLLSTLVMSGPMTWLDWTVIGMIACAYVYIIYKFEEIGGGKQRD